MSVCKISHAKFSNLYLVIFCRPFIQLLGNLEELKNKTYNTPARESYDLKQQDYKIGRVTEVDINKWFQANQLTLNYNKTNCLQFTNKNSSNYNLKLHYQGNEVKSTLNTKFLGMIIDDCLSWNVHIDQIASKLNTACFAIRTIQAIMSPETLRMVYFA